MIELLISLLQPANGLVERLGWVLVHSLWQLTLIGLAARVMLRLLRPCDVRVRYWFLICTLAMCVVVPTFTWLLQVGSDFAANARLPQRITEISSLPLQPQPTLGGMNQTSPLIVGEDDVKDQPSNQPTPVAHIQSTVSLNWRERVSEILQPWLGWLVACWAIGAALFALRPIAGWFALRKLKRFGVADASPVVQETVAELSRRLRLRRLVRVLESSVASVPMVIGYVRPVILLPVSLVANIPVAQLDAILAHELAHVRRHDFVVNLLQTLTETLLFFHPAVWWLSRQIRIEREHCCDDMVVRAMDNRSEYGRALLAIAELQIESIPLVLGAGDGALLSRIRRLTDPVNDRGRTMPSLAEGVVVCAFCACFVTLAFMHVEGIAQTPAEQETAEPEQDTETPNGGVVDPDELDGEFEDLAKQFEKAQEVYSVAYEAATTDEERSDVYRRLDPENAIADDFLTFAEVHPNTHQGVDALAFLIGRAVSYGDVDAPAIKARQAAIKLAAEKFMDQENLDRCLKGFDAGVVFPEAEASFRIIAEKSPHPHVRAAALLELAEWLKFKASIPEIKRNIQEQIDQSDANDFTSLSKREFDAFTDPIDPQAAIGEAIEIAQRIQREYPDLPAAAHEGKGTAELRYQRVSDKEAKSWKLRSYAQQAASLEFELFYLARGRSAPDIEGTDAEGKTFRLSDYRGRVVVLMFTANWCGPCVAMYPENRKLSERLSGKPFALLAVSDSEQSTYNYDRGEATWRMMFDGRGGPIATQWNVDSFPTTFVLDHHGVIRHRGLRGEELAKAVDELLVERERDDSAAALIAAHPIDDSPLLKEARRNAQRVESAVPTLSVRASGVLEAFAVDPNGKFVVTCGRKGKREFFEPGSEQWTQEMEAHRLGKKVGVIEMWDATTGELLHSFTDNALGEVTQVAVSPDGKTLATCGQEYGKEGYKGVLLLWSIQQRKRIKRADEQMGTSQGIAFSPNGKWLATTDKGIARIWDARTLQTVAELKVAGQFAESPVFSDDSRLLAACGHYSKQVKIWNTSDWSLKRQVNAGELYLSSLRFTPDGSQIAVGGVIRDTTDGIVKFFRVADGRETDSTDYYTDVSNIDIDSEGKYLAITGGMTIHVRDLVVDEVVSLIHRRTGSSDDRIRFTPIGLAATEQVGNTVTFYDLSYD
ncbi:Regulatory protein BlaR1 [Rubripirellula tenax]|uniref:Regulatory protein BlaR1 n=1 Tax=Rubripirellula tenax TaxID=2528015 RepID=A0A5C6E4B4_9BACT|nr:M56 family metallopeptidase [Rubripirellula tenax]TWU43660.1 Regulatory protein BlaR1 [Rubripirellula tenax]